MVIRASSESSVFYRYSKRFQLCFWNTVRHCGTQKYQIFTDSNLWESLVFLRHLWSIGIPSGFNFVFGTQSATAEHRNIRFSQNSICGHQWCFCVISVLSLSKEKTGHPFYDLLQRNDLRRGGGTFVPEMYQFFALALHPHPARCSGFSSSFLPLPFGRGGLA